MFQGSTSLKYYKRLGIHKNSSGTVQFNPLTREGRSYNWTFCGVVNGVVLFNTYNWSPTTSGHQTAVSSVLSERKIKAVYADFGRVDIHSVLASAHVERLFRSLVESQIDVEMSRDGTRVKLWREGTAQDYALAFETLLKIGAKLSLKRQNELRSEVYASRHAEIQETEFLKACKNLDLKNAELTNEINLDNL